MPRDKKESLKEIVEHCERWISDANQRKDLLPTVVDLRDRTNLELSLFQDLPESADRKADEILGPKYEEVRASAERTLALSGCMNPTHLYTTMSGASGGTLEALRFCGNMMRAGTEEEKCWGRSFVQAMADFDETSNRLRETQERFRKVAPSLSPIFTRAVEASKRARAGNELYAHVGNELRIVLDKVRDLLLRRLRTRSPSGQVAKKWSAIDTALRKCVSACPSARTIIGQFGPLYERLSTMSKERGDPTTESEMDSIFATFVDLCYSAALFFDEFDNMFGWCWDWRSDATRDQWTQ